MGWCIIYTLILTSSTVLVKVYLYFLPIFDPFYFFGLPESCVSQHALGWAPLDLAPSWSPFSPYDSSIWYGLELVPSPDTMAALDFRYTAGRTPTVLDAEMSLTRPDE